MTVRTYLFALLLGSAALALPAHAQPRDDEDEEEKDFEGPEANAAAVSSLDDLIQASVQYAPEFSRAKLDREAAQAAAGAAKGEQGWVLRLYGQYKRESTSPNVEVPLFSNVGTEALSTGLGLGRSLPTGGRFDVDLGVAKQTREVVIPEAGSAEDFAARSSGSGIEEFTTVIQSSARLTFKQPLVRGFGPDVALAGERKADLQFAVSTIEAQLKAEEMIRDIVNGYWELAFASYEVDWRNRAIELAEAQEKITRDELRAGKSPPSALSAVQYEINLRKERLLKAQIDMEKKSLDLRRKVGLGLDKRSYIIKPSDKFEIGKDEFDIDETLARSRKANRKMASIALQKKASEIDLKVAKSGILPKVDVNLQAALIGQGNDTGESFSGVTDGPGYEVLAGLEVQFDLSGAAKANYEASLAKRRRIDVDREDLERQIDAEVVSAVKGVTFARVRVGLAEKAIGNADTNWKSEQGNFQAGRSTNYSVMQRQTELIEAQLARGRAVVDYHMSVATLQYLSGTILEQYRINVRPKAKKRGSRE